MLKTKVAELIDKREQVPDEFWQTATGKQRWVLWFLDRQKPSVEANYSFDEERFGITREGNIIWGFDSGCSCPTPWDEGDPSQKDPATYQIKEWKEFDVIASKEGFDPGWEKDSSSNLDDFLLLIKDNPDISDILMAKNAEIRRYLIKRVGYENITKAANVEVLQQDDYGELLKIDEEKYVKVKDKSTQRIYLLYVPENIKYAQEGIAWTFGLAAKDYHPDSET